MYHLHNPARPKIRAAHAAEESHLHDNRGADARSRHRRKFRDLQRGARGSTPAAPLPKSRATPEYFRAESPDGRHRRQHVVHKIHADSRAKPHSRKRRRFLSHHCEPVTEREPEAISANRVSQNFFRVLGISPNRGRDFLPEEEAEGAGDVAIISDGFWHSHFGADPVRSGA